MLRADEKSDALAWRDLPPMPQGVFFAAGTSHGKIVVITGGLNQLAQSIDASQIYDAAAQTWKAGPKLDIRRMMHVQTALDDPFVLIAGGKTGDAPNHLKPLASACLLDFKSSKMFPLPALPHPMGEPTAHRLKDGKVLVIGGESACVFDPRERKWTATIKLKEPREAHASVLLADGRVVVIGGVNRKSIEVIDVKSGTSAACSVELPVVTDDHRAAVLPDGRIWVLAGQHSQTGDTNDRTYLITLENPPENGGAVRGTIAGGPPLGIKGGAADQAMGVIGPFIFLAGGESQQQNHDTELNAVRLLDPRVTKVFTLPPMAIAHDDAVALTIENRIVVFGGYRVGDSTFPGLIMPTAESRVESLELSPAKLK